MEGDATEKKSSKAIWIQRGIIVAIVLAAVIAYAVSSDVRDAVGSVLTMFATGDFSVASEFMAEYGPYAAVVSFLLMVFQSVAAPLPAFLITIANANLFGWWQGAILSWTSAMAGAAVCFWIAKALGREVVEKLTSKAGLAWIDEFFQRHGSQSVLVARLLPFVSFDFVSYFAGLTSMSFGPFFIATGIGQLPATIVYSYVGGMLTGGAQMLMYALLILFALAVLTVIIRQVYVERTKRKAAKRAEGEAGANAKAAVAGVVEASVVGEAEGSTAAAGSDAQRDAVAATAADEGGRRP